jgi:hypothetical protein
VDLVQQGYKKEDVYIIKMKIACLLDRSGSMQLCLDDTIGGYNAFLKNSDQSDTISLYLFDHEFTEVYKDKLISEASPLKHSTYIPRGSTALLDAIASILKIDDTPKTVVIITDGEENSSRKHNYGDISRLISEKKELGWKFIFMGANQDAIATACRMNIEEGTALTFGTQNIVGAFRSASAVIKRSQEGKDLVFTQEERLLSC